MTWQRSCIWWQCSPAGRRLGSGFWRAAAVHCAPRALPETPSLQAPAVGSLGRAALRRITPITLQTRSTRGALETTVTHSPLPSFQEFVPPLLALFASYLGFFPTVLPPHQLNSSPEDFFPCWSQYDSTRREM